MIIDPALFWLIVSLAALAGALIGWDRAVHNHRARQRAIETNLADLEEQLSVFHEEERQDQQRAWINVGKRNVLAQMENTVRKIRSTFDPEPER